MDITKQIQLLIDGLKANKSIAQPWKNYAVSDAQRLLAVVEKGLRITNVTPPPEFLNPPESQKADCVCDPGKKASVNCPVHGINL